MAKTGADVAGIIERIEGLSPARQLMLAAQLMAAGHVDVAMAIAGRVVDEFHASRLGMF